MNTSEMLGRNDYAAMVSGGKPYKAYIKTILGKVLVKYWDNFTNSPAEMLLYGDPKKRDETCIVKVWNEREDAYFKSTNRQHLKQGTIINYELPEVTEPVETPIEQASDETLKEIINSKFMALQNKLNKIDSVAVLFRMKNLADEMDKSEKIVRAIEARISEVQSSEYTTSNSEEE